MISDTIVTDARVAVVIPCYKASRSLAFVVGAIPSVVERIYCVNDASPDDTGQVVDWLAKFDPRVTAIHRPENGGVGAATVTGFKAAIADGMTVIVKLDSDGQMNPAFIPTLIAPILSGEADFVKGNRFFDLDSVRSMPPVRLIGNAGLSFLSKLSTGYWQMFDPTNGYLAVHAAVAGTLPLDKLHPRYFFESDLLFRLSTLGANMVEVPMEAVYADEKSNLNELHAAMTFPPLHLRNFTKRIFYNYFLRGFSAASLHLVGGLLLALFGLVFGARAWIASAALGEPATAGTVMVSALPIFVGFQLLLNFLSHDVASAPRAPIHRYLARYKVLKAPVAETTDGDRAASA
ncbi:MAG: glycosyltransferase family 2 protein [Alphaproteobacteria bacterium]|nr:glycosyltransferase family 2 protein [Alphaproteobacteria bacterium]